MNQLNIFEMAGPLSWPLIGMGALAITILIERMIYLRKTQINASDYLDGITNLLKNRRLLEALTLCEETRGPVAAVICAALLHRRSPKEEIQDAIHSVAMLEIPALEKRQKLLGTVAALSPLLGLLGTVLASLDALQRLGQQEQSNNPTDFTTDLSMALVTTVIGLVIAIGAYCGKEFIRSRMDSVVRDMEWAAHGIFRYLTVEADIERRIPHETFQQKNSDEDESEEI
tara:strand:+ start:132 stop:818 length:687 start_codon:yes stop_codon:yes gene_type:complete